MLARTIRSMGSRASTTVGASTTCEDERFGSARRDGSGRRATTPRDGTREWMDGWMRENLGEMQTYNTYMHDAENSDVRKNRKVH